MSGFDEEFWNLILDHGELADVADPVLGELTEAERELWESRRPAARVLAEQQMARWGTTACESLVAISLNVPPEVALELLEAQAMYDDHNCTVAAEILDHFTGHVLDALREAAVLSHTDDAFDLLYDATPIELGEAEHDGDDDECIG